MKKYLFVIIAILGIALSSCKQYVPAYIPATEEVPTISDFAAPDSSPISMKILIGCGISMIIIVIVLLCNTTPDSYNFEDPDDWYFTCSRCEKNRHIAWFFFWIILLVAVVVILTWI